ncbi:MAG: HEAT repeat domain-containing protein [Bacteroidales bacterium]
MAELQESETLSTVEATAVTEFARACRAATRAVGLYPPEHPAIVLALGRLSEVCARGVTASWQLGVSPGMLQLDGRRLPRPDPAVVELADLLHAHHVGAISVGQGTDGALWLKLLRLLASPPEDVQRQGGLARLWAAAGGRQIEIREVDYGAVLADREAGDAASWDSILRNCLQGETVDFDEQTLSLLAEIAGDAKRLVDLAKRLEEGAGSGSLRSPAAALLAMLHRVVAMLANKRPDDVGPVLDNIAVAACRFSPDVVVELLASHDEPCEPGSVDLSAEVLARLTEANVATFVANSVASQGATARLAAAFFALVPDPALRPSVLGMAREQAGALPVADSPDFERIWRGIEDMLGSYTDEAYVSKEYATDLATARAKAAAIDEILDDPPERVAQWLSTIGDANVRALDLQLLLDLLGAEDDTVRWRELVDVVIGHVEDLLLIGDFASAAKLVEAVGAAADQAPGEPQVGQPAVSRESAAQAALDRLVKGDALRNIDLHAIGDEDMARVKRMCLSLGARVIGPLAELLAAEDRARTRQRLTDLLLAFGALGRQCAEQLMHSQNASVRRVAVHLLREFGGSEALPDLASLLDDAEPHVQREAVRAILLIGTNEAYAVLDRALRSGTARSRESILRLLEGAGDERAAPLFAYIVRRGDYRGAMQVVYMKALTALGRFGGDEAVAALKEGLYRGEWWAPRRTARLRQAAAASLWQLGTPGARDVLNEAATRGPRGSRAAVRPYLQTGTR